MIIWIIVSLLVTVAMIVVGSLLERRYLDKKFSKDQPFRIKVKMKGGHTTCEDFYKYLMAYQMRYDAEESHIYISIKQKYTDAPKPKYTDKPFWFG